MLRASLFQSDVRDSLYTQTNITVTPNVTSVQNVDRVRTRGIELAYSGQDVARDLGVRGVDIEANAAFTQARTLADAANPAYVGKVWPRMPRVRANLFASWHASAGWTLGAGLRYSGRQYGTLDNTDVLPEVYGGTSRFFTVDLKAGYRVDKHVTLALGVDNLTDRRYFVYHPYPSRTFYGQLKWRL